ncbi:Metacaspase type II [Favolaschia claudopus]|uniref:Metacaspase type II n=1 Tax=Favolaschia claudopus TaxID=2862362 RepID=A0AAW0A5S0_9AGAR
MAHIDFEKGSQFSLSQPLDSASTHKNGDYAGQKRALLIGIRKSDGYAGHASLNTADDEVFHMRDLLIQVYHYEESEITILLDDDVHVQPTRENILAAVAVFVKNVKAGDRLCFHYSGYSTKVLSPNSRSSDEPDDLMACIVPCDGEEMKILNTELRDILVRPLPAGSYLVAILDACYSGSLLALKHYRCNRVYVPWVWRGRRDSESIRNAIVRRGARLVSLPQNLRRWLAPYLPTRHSIAQNGRQPSNIGTGAISGRTTAASLRTSPLTRLRPGGNLSVGMLRTLSVFSQSSVSAVTKDPQITADGNWIEGEVRRCESPLGQFRCSGWCRNIEGGSTMLEEDDWGDVKADVISLASCKYSQWTWEAEGVSMTLALVDLLRENPERSLQDVLMQVSHKTYSFAFSRHSRSRQYKAQLKNYGSYLVRQIERLERGNKSTASLVTPDTPGIAMRPTFPYATPCRGPKQSTLLRTVGEQIQALKQRLNVVRQDKGYDMNAFQNPELSSPRPLDMNRSWRL